MIRLLVLAIGVLTLTACGGDSSGGDSGKKASATDIVGVWYDTVSKEEWQDVIYWVIREDGTFLIYDYDGDAFDQGQNCYWTGDSGSFTYLGDGVFYADIDFSSEDGNVTITTKGNSITISDNSGSFKLTKTSLLESDLSPEC